MPPAVKGTLTGGKIREALAIEDLGLERAMEAFVLALGLRMEWSTVGNAHTQTHEPNGEDSVRLITRVAPWRAVVHQHCVRQAVAVEHWHQLRPHGDVLLVAACRDRQRIARMVIEHRQRMTAPLRHREVAFEVHLPQLVGRGALETLIRPGMLMAARLELAVAAQDLGDRARRWHCHLAVALHHSGDLAATPRVVALLPNAQNLGFQSRRRAPWAVQRSARSVCQSGAALPAIARKPFVAFGSADPKTTAQFAQVSARRHRQPNELFPLVHHRQLPPRHRASPCPTESDRTSVTHVSEQLLPMSPVCTKGRVGVGVTRQCVGE
jgi:hypothetical protein